MKYRFQMDSEDKSINLPESVYLKLIKMDKRLEIHVSDEGFSAAEMVDNEDVEFIEYIDRRSYDKAIALAEAKGNRLREMTDDYHRAMSRANWTHNKLLNLREVCLRELGISVFNDDIDNGDYQDELIVALIRMWHARIRELLQSKKQGGGE